MLSVRKYAINSLVIIIALAGIYLLLTNEEILSQDFFVTMNRIIHTRKQIEPYHGYMVSISFWILILSSMIEAIFSEKSGLEIIGKFILPIGFSLCISIWGVIALSSPINTIWFWLSFYVGLIVCLRIAFTRISRIHGAGPDGLLSFLKSKPSQNDPSVSIIDKRVLYITQFTILCDWIIIIISFVIYCLHYKWIF